MSPLFEGIGKKSKLIATSEEFEVSADQLGEAMMKAYAVVRQELTGQIPKREVNWDELNDQNESKMLIRSVSTILLDQFEIRNKL